MMENALKNGSFPYNASEESPPTNSFYPNAFFK